MSVRAFDPSVKKWEDVPLVKFQALLKKQSWWNKINNNILNNFPSNKRIWNKDHTRWPSLITVKMWYKALFIPIDVYFTQDGFFLIKWTECMPVKRAYRVKQVRKTKSKKASTYIKALETVKSVYDAVSTFYENKIDVAIQKNNREEEEKKKIKELESTLDCKLTSYFNTVVLHKDEAFNMSVLPTIPSKNEKDYWPYSDVTYNSMLEEYPEACYEIDRINGLFTAEEIKQISMIVCSNPRAILERLTKK